jgi:hypothetical protein
MTLKENTANKKRGPKETAFYFIQLSDTSRAWVYLPTDPPRLSMTFKKSQMQKTNSHKQTKYIRSKNIFNFYFFTFPRVPWCSHMFPKHFIFVVQRQTSFVGGKHDFQNFRSTAILIRVRI